MVKRASDFRPGAQVTVLNPALGACTIVKVGYGVWVLPQGGNPDRDMLVISRHAPCETAPTGRTAAYPQLDQEQLDLL